MKKKLLTLASTGFIFFSMASTAFAAAPPDTVNVQVNPPAAGVHAGASSVLTNALTIIFIAAALLVLFFIILGAFNWITSGGDKEKVGKARGQIVHALIGLAILALAVLIITVVGQILNINIFNLQTIPSLNNTKCTGDTVFDPTSGGCVPKQIPQ